MTRNEREIVTSDGIDVSRFRDPRTFAEVRHITVKDGTRQVNQSNELEYVKGKIYANLWHQERIARISPRDGHVLGWIDLSGLLPEVEKPNAEAVLNGIAYDAKQDRLFVTGKQWPLIFEIRLTPPVRAKKPGRE